jgi:hypothetical protein
MPNATLPFMRSLTPNRVRESRCEVIVVDEYVETDLSYLSLLRAAPGSRTLLALAGVQSHQMNRAIDLAAYAREHGVSACVIGGPHPMTCDTSALQGRGVSFALAEAEVIWPVILEDALSGELNPVYGSGGRWSERLDPPVLVPPSRRELRRFAVPMLGVYPARGCPYRCNFCSVIQIAGRLVRSQPVETTIRSLRAARDAGVKLIMFTSDNFNKYGEARDLLEAMVAEKIRLPFFAQCDAVIDQDEDLVALMARAGCFQIFVGVESFSRAALLEAGKRQNHPERYGKIVEVCRRHGISSHFSNIIGFPGDTRESILEHLSTLRRLGPDLASFYILTPIPGTEQYGEFLERGWIAESNLDRYDGTCATWRHPVLTHDSLRDLLFHCYREFYMAGDVARKLLRLGRSIHDFRRRAAVSASLGNALQSRFGALTRTHPLAGGMLRLRLDTVEDYLPYRRRVFGIDTVPLPSNLPLSEADAALHRKAAMTG